MLEMPKVQSIDNIFSSTVQLRKEDWNQKRQRIKRGGPGLPCVPTFRRTR